MKTVLILASLAAVLLPACTSNGPYRPATWPEKTELSRDRLDVYPEDVRKDLTRNALWRVAWAGVVVSNDVSEETFGGRMRMDTVFEHHYFNWQQEKGVAGIKLQISPRGEGRFRMRWNIDRSNAEATEADALNSAAPGKLAIVYGTPQSVDRDGTIVLRYHYIRILDPSQFTVGALDYGRAAGQAPVPSH